MSVASSTLARDTQPSVVGPTAGVNVAGYLRTESGVGVAARRYIRALEHLGVPLALRDLSRLSGNRDGDATYQSFSQVLPYDVSLVCVDVEPHFAVLSELGDEFFRGRYNVGIWAWELPRFPEKWRDRFAYYDEIWVATSFIANVLSPISPVPVVRIPPVLTAEGGSREAGRQKLNVEADEFVFLFVFDVNSHLARKNPLAVIDAFRLAFSPTERARLVLKCVNADSDRPGFDALVARAAGLRVDIQTGYWPASDVRNLMAACDVYVSLHRAEGTGLTISDAMSLGKPVIATGWSGNMEFMTVANSFPVDYELVEVARSCGPYRKGEIWAEPSVADAAAQMRHVFDRRDEALAVGRRASADISAAFSAQAIAGLISDRLKAIGQRRRFEEYRRETQQAYFDYRAMIDQIHAAVDALPAGAAIAVASKGDDSLVSFSSRVGHHFPQTPRGVYAGNHSADSASALEQLQQMIERGARYFLLPSTMNWWLDYYVEFGTFLNEQCEVTQRGAQYVIHALPARSERPASETVPIASEPVADGSATYGG